MTRFLTVGAAQMGPIQRSHTRHDVVERMLAQLREAHRMGCELVVFPELTLTTFFPRWWMPDQAEIDSFFEREMPSNETAPLFNEARRLGLGMSFGYAELVNEGGRVRHFNTSIIVEKDGRIAGKYRKVHPAALLSLEKIYFRGGSSFPVFRVGDWTIGFSICYDNLFPESCRCLALNGAELIIAPYATPIATPWENFLTTRALENGVFLAACNHVGREGEWQMSGKSLVIDPLGEILATANDASEQILVTAIERERVIQARRRFPLFRDRRPDAYRAICRATEDLHR